ncbi:MAG: magnesium transporter [Longimicrobiales bacterium]
MVTPGTAETERIDPQELREAWWVLAREDRLAGFRLLQPGDAEEFFFDLDAAGQHELVAALTPAERRLWLRLLAPDDAVDLIQEADTDERPALLSLLDEATRKEVTALLAYAEDEAGGLMSSRFARVRPDMTVDAAIAYLRRQAISSIEPETIYYVYVLDSAQRLRGVISFRDLFSAASGKVVQDVMKTDVVSVPDDMDQEAVARLFAEHDLLAMPVVDTTGVLKGIVTVDDIVDVVEEEATEDAQKYGGMAALDEPYLRIGFLSLVRKRAGWLSLLFFAQLMTAAVLQGYQDTIANLAFLAVFMPLIISSGGNSGSQASTLVIRAMAVGEVRVRDWWRVARREIAAGLALGAILAVLGFVRIVLAHAIGIDNFHVDTGALAFTISLSLLAVAVIGTMVGSMLPFLLRLAGLDPASASAPLVATVSDVTGILVYFSLAAALLRIVV